MSHLDKFPPKPEGGYSKNCRAEGCGKFSRIRGFCSLHYKRIYNFGSLDLTRVDGRKKHHMYPVWYHAVNDMGVVDEWKDFWKFVSEVPDRPSHKHRFFRKDYLKPAGPDNFEWKTPTLLNFMSADGKKAYQKMLRTKNVRYEKKQTLGKKGVTLEQYDSMLAAQNGVCAICLCPERMIRNGKVQSLCVDHDHMNGNVRGLLCVNCNKILGHAHDDINKLKNSISYLESYEKGLEENDKESA